MERGDEARGWGEAATRIQQTLQQLRETFDAAWAIIWGPIPFDARAPFVCVLFEARDPARAPATALGMAVPIVGNPWAESMLANGSCIAMNARTDPRLKFNAALIEHNAITQIASALYARDGVVWGVAEVYGTTPLRLPSDPAAVLARAAQDVAEIVASVPAPFARTPDLPERDPMNAAALHDLKSSLAAQSLLVASFEKDFRAAASGTSADWSRLRAMLESLSVLRESVAHANELARVLTLGTLAPGSRVSIDLPGLVRLSLAAVPPDLRSRFDVEVAPEIAELGVPSDAPAILRAVHNLAQNAAVAIQRLRKARVRVRLRIAGEDVLIEVDDDGPGVPAAVLERLFQPGVTSRERASGHGFGLHTARTAVEGLGGSLTLYSVPGHGARFTIRLPKHAVGM